jgi:D-cysteine desulfhydrase family pyridoxal phosphate-dependent enzyme
MKFAVLPTPVQRLPRLSEALGGPEVLIKRDDLTGLAFGGNKTRKLEYLIADALTQRADLVITTGAVQSNHCRQTAAAAARAGLQAVLVLVGTPPADPSANLFLDQLLGAKVIWSDQAGREQVLEEQIQQAQANGRKPYLIPYGGSNYLGAYAYLEGMRELQAQLGGPGPDAEDGAGKDRPPAGLPDWIVFATSSGGTQAGMTAGIHSQGLELRVLGISVDESERVLKPRVIDLANQVLEQSGIAADLDPGLVEISDQYRGAGYAVMGEREIEAVRTFAELEGVLLDPVYTGRAAAGLIDWIRKGKFEPDQKVLFWHTGGTPALFAAAYQDRLLV